MGNPLESLLSGLMGGGSGGTDPLSFVSGLLGGGASQSISQVGGGVGNLLQAITNGGGSSAATNNVLGPLVSSLGSKLNMSPDVAEQVVSFATHHLVSGHLSGPANTNHQELLNQIASGKVTKDFLQQSGMSEQLAKQAGIDPKVATDGLKHVLENFGQHMK